MVPHQFNPAMKQEQCRALSASGERCTRRVNKKSDCGLCGTHMRGTPNGTIAPSPAPEQQSRIEVRVQDICGINYYIDDEGSVYDPRDIVGRLPMPRVVATWIKDGDGNIGIPDLGLEPAPEGDTAVELETV